MVRRQRPRPAYPRGQPQPARQGLEALAVRAVAHDGEAPARTADLRERLQQRIDSLGWDQAAHAPDRQPLVRLVLGGGRHVHAELGNDRDGKGRGSVAGLTLKQRGCGLAPRRQPPHLAQRAAATPADGEWDAVVLALGAEQYDGDVEPGCYARHLPRRSEERRVGKECRSRWSPYN